MEFVLLANNVNKLLEVFISLINIKNIISARYCFKDFIVRSSEIIIIIVIHIFSNQLHYREMYTNVSNSTHFELILS